MNIPSSSQTCRNCNELKPLSVFALGRDSYGNIVYSNICDTCRNKFHLPDEDERGGKQGMLTIDQEYKDLQSKQQKEFLEKMRQEKQDYLNTQDDKLKVDNFTKEDSEKKLSNQRNQNNPKDNKPRGLFSPTDPHLAINEALMNTLVDTEKTVVTNQDKNKSSNDQSKRSVLTDSTKAIRQNVNRFNINTINRHKTTNQQILNKKNIENNKSKSTAGIFTQIKTKEKTAQDKKSQEEKIENTVRFIRKTWGK